MTEQMRRMKRKMKFELFMNFAIPCIMGAGIGFFGGILLPSAKPDETALTELLDAAEIIAAEYAKLKQENRRIEAENARLRGVIHDCLWMSRGINYPNNPETIVQQHLDFQALLAGALE